MREKRVKESKIFKKELEKKGFKLVRVSGDHFIYKRDNHTMIVPLSLNKMMERRLRKELAERKY